MFAMATLQRPLSTHTATESPSLLTAETVTLRLLLQGGFIMRFRRRLIACAALLIGPIAGAQPAVDANWLGVWQGELEGRPGVTLTVVDDSGELAGTVVFEMISRDKGVIGHDA